jgi:hypothetical protein
LGYDKDFWSYFFECNRGVNRMRQLQRRTSANTTGGIALDEFYNLANSVGTPFLETLEQERGINSVFGVASFGFDNWLYLDLTARNDWTSTLPAGNNDYFYPSASLSAVLSELPFLSNFNALSFAKIRASIRTSR